MNILGLLEKPDSGRIKLFDEKDQRISPLRRNSFSGFLCNWFSTTRHSCVFEKI
uniref:hypothetical protein n=1 Tax=Paenibacillus sp. FSL H3-0469 TaxID=2954506 RepID=UPI0040482FCF